MDRELVPGVGEFIPEYFRQTFAGAHPKIKDPKFVVNKRTWMTVIEKKA